MSAWRWHRVQLLRLELHPAGGNKPDTTAYVATLLVEKP